MPPKNELTRLGESVSTMANDLRRRADRLGRTDISRRITAEAERWSEARSSVVFVGPRAAGKSSLVASLVGRSDLPLTTATAVPVLVRSSLTERALVVDTDGRTAERTVVGLTIDPTRTQYVELHVDAPRMIDGVTLVDTPGAGSVADPHGNQAYLASRRADQIIVVVDLTAPIARSDLELVQRCVDRFASVILVGTHIERIRGWQSVLQDSTDAILRVAPHLDIVSIGVSPVLADLAFGPDVDDAEALELLDDSGVSALQTEMAQLVDQRRRRRLSNFSTLLDSCATELARDGRVVILASVEQTDDDVSRLAELRQELARVRDDRSSWFAALGDAVTSAREETSLDLHRIVSTLNEQFESRIEAFTGNADGLIDEFEIDAATAASTLAARIADRVGGIIETMVAITEASDLGVRPDIDEIAHQLEAAAAESSEVQARRAKTDSSLKLRATGGLVGVATSSTMMMTAMAGSGGAAALMRVGAFGAATLFSGVSAAVAVAGGRRQRTRQQIRNTVRARTDAIRTNQQTVLKRYFLVVQRSIEASVKELVRDRIAVLERELSELQTTARADASERRRRAATLEDELRNVAALQQQANALSSQLRRQVGP